MPDWMQRLALCSLGVAITLFVWPLATAAALADLVVSIDPRLEDL
jgi:hypothetical protein